MSGFGSEFDWSQFDNRTRTVAGKIRLGERNDEKGNPLGSNYEHFVMRDAYAENPEWMDIIGEEQPKVLYGYLLSHDYKDFLTPFYGMYGQNRTEGGKNIGGPAKCIGPGPSADGTPGLADHHAQKDSNGDIPKRECMGKLCPDYISKKCTLNMHFYFHAPHLDNGLPIRISSGSVVMASGIVNFMNEVNRRMSPQEITMTPIKIFRQPINLPMGKGSKKMKTHHILQLRFCNEQFYAKKFPLGYQRMYRGFLEGDQWMRHRAKEMSIYIEQDFQSYAINEPLQRAQLAGTVDPRGPEDEGIVNVTGNQDPIQETLQDPEFHDLFNTYMAKLDKGEPDPMTTKNWLGRFQAQMQKENIEGSLKDAVKARLFELLNPPTESKQ